APRALPAAIYAGRPVELRPRAEPARRERRMALDKEGSDVIGINRIKTWVLIAALGGAFVLVGSIWGTGGMTIALVIALVFNFSMYWFSDKIAISTTHSKPVSEQEYPQLYAIVRELTQLDHLPMPRIYV